MISATGASSTGLQNESQLPIVGSVSQDHGVSDTSSVEEEEDNRRRLAELAAAKSDNEVTEVEQTTSARDVALLNEESTLPPEPGSGSTQSEVSSLSGVDNTPSIPGSIETSPRSSITGSKPSRRSSYNVSPATTPFERRYKARITSGSSTPRAISPAFLTAHSRQSSTSSQLTIRSQEDENQDGEEERKPWEVIRWTKLKRITQQAFSVSGRKAFGDPTFLSISASIAIGTSKGIILLFDYQQTLKNIIGQGTVAAESGSITSLAISADHTTIASGHASGAIFTWDIAHPAKPFLQIPPISREQIEHRTSEGHVSECAVLHVGFLGQRRTALVSADDNGMAFSHLATRGLGPVTRTVKTTRILGRYPDWKISMRKPSSVLAFGPLPLGNVEQTTDYVGLTALLTPYLLVLISTTPVAQTQYKFPRPKDISAHSAMTGCLAWFPAVNLKSSSGDESRPVSHTKLVYCWSNLLYILEVRGKQDPNADDSENQREFEFKQREKWTCNEAILAVQWLSRSVIVLLTITQRLIILQDADLRVADSSDLISKHIFHKDLFSRQLQSIVDKIIQGDESLHGVLPDAYHMSFKAYKGRLFLLGMNDISMGTLSNWADRLTAMLAVGKPIAAIQLATSYYVGDADKITIGLPDDGDRRHEMVQDKLLELMSGALQHIMADETTRDSELSLRSALEEFARVSLDACKKLHEINFLFDEVYEKYSDVAMQDIFVFELEKYILDASVDIVPPHVLQDILMLYEGHDLGQRLAEVLCLLQPVTMDIERVTNVCRRMRLYDALIHVWNEAADDFVSPLVDLLSLIPTGDQSMSNGKGQDNNEVDDAMKVFPYLAYTLTGRSYPNGEDFAGWRATKAQASIYGFLFSTKETRWPPQTGDIVHVGNRGIGQSSFPYLRRLLDFDSFSFLAMLNEAFEDSFLNRDQKSATNGDTDSGLLNKPITRQHIFDILMGLIKPPDYDTQDKVLLDVFLARNLAKFRQDILLKDKQLDEILSELCTNPIDDLKDECQLSVEYLLTVHKPHDLDGLLSLLNEAEFFRILKATYRREKQYSNWLETHFRDTEDLAAVFDCIEECLRPASGLSARQLTSVKTVLRKHRPDMLAIDPVRTATVFDSCASDMIDDVFSIIDQGSFTQFSFLKAIYEQPSPSQADRKLFRDSHLEQYIELMCSYDPQSVSEYVTGLESGNLRLDRIRPALEKSGVIDAVVILLQHDGLAREAIDRLVAHLKTLQTALVGLLNSSDREDPDPDSTDEAANDLLGMIDKYVKLGIWLCQGEVGRTKQSIIHPIPFKQTFLYTEEELSSVELLWLDLMDATISLSSGLTIVAKKQTQTSSTDEEPANAQLSKAIQTLRDLVQTAFSALLASSITSKEISTSADTSSSPTLERSPTTSNLPRFPALLSTLLTRLSATTATSTILPLLSNLLTSYAFESHILSLARHFLDTDLTSLIEKADIKRRRGWRPSGRACEVCGRRCWGPGAGVNNWEAWKEQQDVRGRESRTSYEERERREASKRRKGKGRVVEPGNESDIAGANGIAEQHQQQHHPHHNNHQLLKDDAVDALVVFKCQHLFHRRCLEGVLGKTDTDVDVVVKYKCPVCM